MFKPLTLLMAIFALLFVGKIAGIGELGGMSWMWVFTPIVLEVVFAVINAYLKAANVYKELAWRWERYFINRTANRNANKIKESIDRTFKKHHPND